MGRRREGGGGGGCVRSKVEDQCLFFFVFLWERCGERELDLHTFLAGEGDRDLFDLLGDLDFVLLGQGGGRGNAVNAHTHRTVTTGNDTAV